MALPGFRVALLLSSLETVDLSNPIRAAIWVAVILFSMQAWMTMRSSAESLAYLLLLFLLIACISFPRKQRRLWE